MPQPMLARQLLMAGAALATMIPALAVAQQASQPTTTAVQEGNAAAPAPAQSAQQPPVQRRPRPAPAGPPEGDDGMSDLGFLSLPPPPVELPDHARRDPNFVGRLDPVQLGLTANPWRGASGAFLSTLLRQMDTPIASRWTHIALRNALLARVQAPRNVNQVDWAAERAWLLLRMGEADAARMLVSGVDVDRFTPKMFQVAVQSALANADPAALCPLQQGIREVEPRVYRLVDAMCAALAGEPETASAQIDAARRRGEMSAIDVSLAQKVIGAASNTGSAVTVEWDPVERLNSWRFGLAAATGLIPPERLLKAAPLRLRAWQAQAPLISPVERLDGAKIAAALGVLSSQALIDLNSLIYESTGPDDLPETDAWQLRVAFTGANREARLEAMRRLWNDASGPLEQQAARAMLGGAASLVRPDPELQSDAVNLIASMLAAGLDRQAAQWAPAVAEMDDEYADPAWAMLALASPEGSNVDVSTGRIAAFIGRDESPSKKRSALLVAGLAGLGHIDASTAGRLSSRYGLRIGRRSRWTRMIDRAAAYGQSGTVLVLTGTGLQAPNFESVPPSHLYHAVAGLNRTGQDFTARMIAAEALART